jgi:phosphatidylethanolamine/phosphatidyl-N-methylethanolamine N-methyltransferase
VKRNGFDVTIETSRRGYRLFAPLYDLVFGPSLQHGRRLAIEALGCRAGDHVLEVCVGSGLSLGLYPKDTHVTGIDLSREMLTKAARRIGVNGFDATAALAQMNVERMAFADGSFDSAVVLYAMSGLPDPVRAAAEIKRVCRPGAKIVIANHFLSRRPVARLCDALLSPIYRLLRYRADLDLDSFVNQAGLEVSEALPANLFGYSTVAVCRDARGR